MVKRDDFSKQTGECRDKEGESVCEREREGAGKEVEGSSRHVGNGVCKQTWPPGKNHIIYTFAFKY